MDECRKSVEYSPFDEPCETCGEGADGDCGGELDIVKACGAALIRERRLFERSEFFLSLIAFSRIAGLLLYLMFRNRSRKHPPPPPPDTYVIPLYPLVFRTLYPEIVFPTNMEFHSTISSTFWNASIVKDSTVFPFTR